MRARLGGPRPRVGCARVRDREKDSRGGGCDEKRFTVGRMQMIGVGLWKGLRKTLSQKSTRI